MVIIIKSILALLFFLCLLDMPYGYFQLFRFLALAGFGFLAYKANEEDKSEQVFIYVALALLFQPFYKIALGREIWNMVDVVVGTVLLGSIFISKPDKTKKKI
jgi:predicted membrane channel-forming protein YqfA (hemolysin III family)